MDSQGRSRRTIKTPKRFDDEDYQSPSHIKSSPTVIVNPPEAIVTPVKSTIQTNTATPKETSKSEVKTTQLKVKLPGLKSKKPIAPVATAPVEHPKIVKSKPSPEKPKTPTEKIRPPRPPTPTAFVEKPPEKIRTPRPRTPPIVIEKPVEKIRPPRPRTPPIFVDVVPNTVLPFWDARTAAEEHEDDNVKELVHCQCEMPEECGLMIQCETCLTWQHGHCLQIEKPEDVIDNYTCSTCSNPRLARESLRFAHDQEWLVKGKLKSFSKVADEQSDQDREAFLKTNRLIEEVLEISRILNSLKTKVKILMTEDDKSHAELKLWRRSWLKKLDVDSIPPTPANLDDFNVDECKSNLRAHICNLEEQVETRLIALDSKLLQLEESIGINGIFEEDEVSYLKKSIKSLETDLRTTRELAGLMQSPID